MRRYKVESSNIDSIGHNFLTKNLEIEFKGGNIYRYKKVPRRVFKDMMGADSKGKFFWKNVRFEYPYKKYRTKDGDKVHDEWKKLERKEKKNMEGQEKVAMSNVAKSAIVGGVVGATGGVVRGAGNTLLNERIPKKKKLKEALKAAIKQGLVGGAAGAATGAVTPAMWDALGGRYEKKASETLDSMYKEAALSQAQKVKLLESMIGAGAGSLVGAGTGAIRARHISKKKGETKEEAKKRMRNNILGGALVGAGTGAATSALANRAARINAKKTIPFYNDADLNKHREDFLKIKDNMWGASLGNPDNSHHIEMTIHIEENEGYIVNRLYREKRCGTAERVDEHTVRFAADVHDASEMLPWLRTFTGRIVSLTCSDPSIAEIFYTDMDALARIYGGEADVS